EDIVGANSATYNIASICDVCDVCDEGSYKVEVSGTGACASQSVTSNAADLVVKSSRHYR
ncbi:hypothetical protein, partial [Flectobacillus sp. BAB-3569]|uniref:hypothetical protein n=1 Tax=Flectobacillus sp. BAB-3569 TaxID=1509483 RepID=UPI000BCDD31F